MLIPLKEEMTSARDNAKKPSAGRPMSRFERNRSRALELFVERGFAQVSLRELASHLELTVGSLYNHCSGKEDLLLEFIEEHYTAMLALFERRPRQASVGTRLPVLVERLIALHDSSPLHFRLAIRELDCLRPSQRQHIERMREQLRQRLSTSLRSTGCHAADNDIVVLELFEHLPLWLSSYPLGDRHKALTQLLISASSPCENRS
ncbi:TetR/AcrR family transcriptional regulator [Pseudomonas stutzeri]|nr:TetR/AcrR family transcriptional regulator [Stutzerimonas stutzeri]MCQ4325310.1 TetR/AcrR family transcriptional regulator [Stutzerimonas stutzeri]